MIRSRRAVVLEDVALETFERRDAQEARRHDPVGVDVVAAHGQAAAGHDENGSAVLSVADLVALLTGHAVTSSSIDRTSTTSPATAAAATMAGLISSVRPVGLPCRPLKLRFDEEAHT